MPAFVVNYGGMTPGYPAVTLLPDGVVDVGTMPLTLAQRSPGAPVTELAINPAQWAAASPTVALPAQSHPAGHAVRLRMHCDVLVTGLGQAPGSRVRLAPGTIISRAVAVAAGLVTA